MRAVPLILLSCFFVSLVGHHVPAAQARLTPEELAQRKQQAGTDPVRLLELCPLVDSLQAEELRQMAARAIAAAPAADRGDLAIRIAPLLAGAASTPDEFRQLLGGPTRVARQMVYRRHVEQWIYDGPLPVCVVWQAQRGQEVRMLTVHPLSGKDR
jgi:hypothetical protein